MRDSFKMNEGMHGYLEVISTDLEGNSTKIEMNNVVCDNIRTIVRDLVLGKITRTNADGQPIELDAPRPAYIVLGYTADLREATSADTKLANPLVWVPVHADENYPDNKVSALVWKGQESILFSITLDYGVANTDMGQFNEIGLAVPSQYHTDNYLATRIAMVNRDSMTKTPANKLTLHYYLSF